MADLVAHIASLTEARPVMVGVGGGVGVGKTTFAAELSADLADQGITVAVLGTDAFLLTNAELAPRGLAGRKGFPESFDLPLLAATLQTLRAAQPAQAPVYSHDIYDRLPDVSRTIEPADAVILEGVIALQTPAFELLDVTVYLDADDGHMRAWFIERFLRLCDRAEGFYRTFATMSAEERLAVADAAWDGINAVNLREHILPTRDRADFVIEKGPDHHASTRRARPRHGHHPFRPDPRA